MEIINSNHADLNNSNCIKMCINIDQISEPVLKRLIEFQIQFHQQNMQEAKN